MSDVFVLIGLVVALVLAASVLKLHPFMALLLTALLGGLAFGLPLLDDGETLGLVTVVTPGFGSTLGTIGLVIILGTVIGVVLDKSGAAITMADWIVKRIGQRFPTVTMSVIGYIVSIPVFCDSGYVILNSLKESMAARQRVSSVAMSVALATGLFATHTLVPPTPGPIAAAGSLGPRRPARPRHRGRPAPRPRRCPRRQPLGAALPQQHPRGSLGGGRRGAHRRVRPAARGARHAARLAGLVRAHLRPDPAHHARLGGGLPDGSAGRRRRSRTPCASSACPSSPCWWAWAVPWPCCPAPASTSASTSA